MADGKSRLLAVKARSREAITFAAQALAVTSVNDKGVFDILPNHANFISLIKNYLVIKKTDGRNQRIELKGPAVLKVYRDKVDIYLGIGNPG